MSKEPISNTGATGDPIIITIAIVVGYDANRAVQVLVTDPTYLSPRTHQKVRWCVYNNLDIALSSVSISALTSAAATTAPLCSNTSNLTTGRIPPGNTEPTCTEFCVTSLCASGTAFQYTVTVKPENGNDVEIHGPRVIIQ